MRKEERMQDKTYPLVHINVYMEHPTKAYSKQFLDTLQLVTRILTFPNAVVPIFDIRMWSVIEDHIDLILNYKHRDEVLNSTGLIVKNIYLMDDEPGPIWEMLKEAGLLFRAFSLGSKNIEMNAPSIRNYINSTNDK